MRLVLVLTITAVLLLVGCSGEQSQATSAPQETVEAQAPVEKVLTQIKEWSGAGIKTTEPFTIGESPWVIGWSHSPSTYGGILQIFVYDSLGNLVTLTANSMTREADNSYVYETGTFYLTMNAANTSWRVQVCALR